MGTTLPCPWPPPCRPGGAGHLELVEKCFMVYPFPSLLGILSGGSGDFLQNIVHLASMTFNISGWWKLKYVFHFQNTLFPPNEIV